MPNLAYPVFPEPLFETPVLGSLSRRDFDFARRRAAGFSWWSNHREFVAERDALYVGYGASGVAAQLQRVPFAAFECWSRLTGAPLNVDGLDEFAAQWRFRALNPGAPILGRFGAPSDPERQAVGAANVQSVYVRPEIFVRWRDDFDKPKLFEAPSLDVYAAYVVEFCLRSDQRSLWPAVKSF